ncbi:MAG: dephospho-CoA kinase [Alphaproteobacteria bacterium]|nr:dephospho-CoA kinase [Alphaproteobacteria bacterium]MCL2505505.1 dephospho-CoA kinase [Alphaproteobacteria bacterium]
MLIIGLTGGIGTGKSTAAKMFEECNIPVFYADKAAHEALEEISDRQSFSREKIADEIFADDEARKKLEAVLHPRVLEKMNLFIEEHKKQKKPFVVLEVPLLFEAGFDTYCDKVICAAASESAQKQRVVSRAGMTPERFEAIKRTQMPEAEKQQKSDFLINTDCSTSETKSRVLELVKKLKMEN